MGERAVEERGSRCGNSHGTNLGQGNLQGSSKYTCHSFHYTSTYTCLVPSATDIPALGSAIERFQRQLALLSESHASSTSSITSLAKQRSELDTRETELRSMIVTAESKKSWFTEFKDWVESVATFLDEKVSLIISTRNITDLTLAVPET